MSGRKSFSATKPGLFRLLLLMLVRPRKGVVAIIGAAPSVRTLVWALAGAGLLRGVLEGAWYYLMRGRPDELLRMLGKLEWYTSYGGA
jgi:hypothetical protein